MIEHDLIDYPYTGSVMIIKDANGPRITSQEP